MKLLLDTHAFLWWNSRDSRLPNELRDAIGASHNEVFISAVTVWEIAIKRTVGKLTFSGAISKSVEGHGFSRLPILLEHAEWAGALPVLHRDPFDRLLVAQAQMEGLTLVTVDAQILLYQVLHL